MARIPFPVRTLEHPDRSFKVQACLLPLATFEALNPSHPKPICPCGEPGSFVVIRGENRWGLCSEHACDGWESAFSTK
jgi:hypothetical protein